jgi:hypothetical protein
MDNVTQDVLMSAGGKSFKRRSMSKSSPRKYHSQLMKHFGGFFEDSVVATPTPPSALPVVTGGGKRHMRVRRSASPVRRSSSPSRRVRRSSSPSRRVRRVGGEELVGGKKKRPRRVRRVGGEEEMEGGKKKRPRRVRRVGGEELVGGKKKRPRRRSASPSRR